MQPTKSGAEFILEPISKLTKDLKKASITLSDQEIRFMVDAYYQIQEFRKASANQESSLEKAEEPHEVISWLFKQNEGLESQIKKALDVWTDNHPVGAWSKSIVGIGPVIAAGLLAHIDITQAPTVGHIWRFGGVDPTSKWEKGQKRPWNGKLKVLIWKAQESFVKVCNHKDDIYGKVYKSRKEQEVLKNNNGDFAEQAAEKLRKFKISPTTDAYKAYAEGKLPPAHIHARAARYAVKLFLAHYHHALYRHHYKMDPPKPYAISILGHAHYIAPPPMSF